MMRALKIMELKIALCGEASPMTFRRASGPAELPDVA